MRQGEIWLVDLNPTIGAEISKRRPALVVNDNRIGKLPLRIVVPITDWKSAFEQAPWMVHLMPDARNGLSKPSAVDTFQLRSLACQRLVHYMGSVDHLTMGQVRAAMKLVLSLP